jgi:hypothetical protein
MATKKPLCLYGGAVKELQTGDALPSSGMTAAETTSAVDITLTSASANVQAISMTATGKVVTLPTPNTMTAGFTFVFKNTGTIPFVINHYYGYPMLSLEAGQMAMLYLTYAVGSGRWAIGNLSNESDLANIFTSNSIGASGVYGGNISVTRVSDTQAVVAYSDTNGAKARVMTISGGVTISFGTALSLPNTWVSVNAKPIVTAINTTQCIIAYQAVTTNYTQAVIVTISGTTLTAGTPTVVGTAAGEYSGLAVISSTSVLLTYLDATSTYKAVVLSISGTTITANTPASIMVAYGVSLVSISPTSFGWLGYDGANIKACVLTVSGTTVTVGTLLTIVASTTSGTISITKLSDTKLLASYGLTDGTAQCCVLTVWGTNLVAGSLFAVPSSSGVYVAVTAISATKAILIYREVTTLYLRATTLHIKYDDSIAIGSVANINGVVSSTYPDVKKLTDTSVILAWQEGTNNYLDGLILGVSI